MRTHEVTLLLPSHKRQITVREDQSILDAALREGIELPNSCCQGWCLSCAGRLISGRVDHPHARRYYAQDAEAGFVLPCTAEPRADCVIETHLKEVMKAFRRSIGLPAPGG